MIGLKLLKEFKHTKYGLGCLYFEDPLSKIVTCSSDKTVKIYDATPPYNSLKIIDQREGDVNQVIRWSRSSFLSCNDDFGIRGYSIIPPFPSTKEIRIENGLNRFKKIDDELILGFRRSMPGGDEIIVISYSSGEILRSMKAEFSNSKLRISSVFSHSYYYNGDDETLYLGNFETMKQIIIKPKGFNPSGRFIALDVIESKYKRNEDLETIATGGYDQSVSLINCERNNNSVPTFSLLKIIKLKEIHHNGINQDYQTVKPVYFLKFIQDKYIGVCSGGGGFSIIELDFEDRKKKIEEYYSEKYEPKKEDKNLELTIYRTRLHTNGIWDLKIVNSLSTENKLYFLSASFDEKIKLFYLTGLGLVNSDLMELEKKDLEERIEWLRNEDESKEFLSNSLECKEKVFISLKIGNVLFEDVSKFLFLL